MNRETKKELYDADYCRDPEARNEAGEVVYTRLLTPGELAVFAWFLFPFLDDTKRPPLAVWADLYDDFNPAPALAEVETFARAIAVNIADQHAAEAFVRKFVCWVRSFIIDKNVAKTIDDLSRDFKIAAKGFWDNGVDYGVGPEHIAAIASIVQPLP